MRRKLHRLLRFALSPLLLWAPGYQVDGQVQRDEPIRFRVATNLILVDVRVTDSSGRPLPGLKLEEFRLIEEGEEQKITYFREVSIPLETRTPGRSSRGVETAGPVPETADPPGFDTADKRLLVLLFNLSSASLQERLFMQEAARKFLEGEMTDQDAVAVLVMDSGLEMLTDLTGDRDQVLATLGRLGGIAEETDISLPDPDEEAGEAAEFLADETELALFQTNTQLAAIQSVADAFRDVAGRKALIYFSAGLANRGVETIDQMRLATDLCNRANMSIYPVDSRGLVALSPGGGAQRGGGGGRSIFNGRASLNQLAGLQQSQEGLLTLASDTGGRALIDDNDLSKVFLQAREDSSHYYLLGYETPRVAADGRFRKIEVTATVAGSSVVSRRGYYSDRPYRQMSPAEREFQLLQAVVDNQPQADFPVLGGAEYFPDEEGYEVAVLAALDHHLMATGGDDSDLNLEILMVARTGDGRTLDALRDQISIRRRQVEGETSYVYQNLLYLEPGSYRLALHVRNNQTGRMGSSSLNLELPVADAVLPSSSLVLAGGWKTTESRENYRIRRPRGVTVVENPLEVAGRVLVPRVDAVFHAGEDLYLHLKIPAGAPVDYRIELHREESRVYENSWKPAREQEPWQEVNARIPLADLPSGTYRVTVQVRTGSQTRALSRSFELVR